MSAPATDGAALLTVDARLKGDQRVRSFGLLAIVLVAAAGLLWAFNFSGADEGLTSTLYSETLQGVSATALVAAAPVWGAWVLVTAISARRWSWWYAIAPVGGVVVATLLAT